jgi:hypothetical protein
MVERTRKPTSAGRRVTVAGFFARIDLGTILDLWENQKKLDSFKD